MPFITIPVFLSLCAYIYCCQIFVIIQWLPNKCSRTHSIFFFAHVPLSYPSFHSDFYYFIIILFLFASTIAAAAAGSIDAVTPYSHYYILCRYLSDKCSYVMVMPSSIHYTHIIHNNVLQCYGDWWQWYHPSKFIRCVYCCIIKKILKTIISYI